MLWASVLTVSSTFHHSTLESRRCWFFTNVGDTNLNHLIKVFLAEPALVKMRFLFIRKKTTLRQSEYSSLQQCVTWGSEYPLEISACVNHNIGIETHDPDGKQNSPLQNVLLGHVGYFELEGSRDPGDSRKSFTSPRSA